MEPLTFSNRRNFVKQADYDVVTEQVAEWLEAGVIAIADSTSTTNFALLAVSKHGPNGERTGTRVCLDLSTINTLLIDDYYELPSTYESLHYNTNFKGPEFYY